MVHASPPGSLTDGIRLRDESGSLIPAARDEWAVTLQDTSADVLIVGHTHQLIAERFGKLLLLNPGSTCFNNSCVILQLPEKEVEFVPLGGKRLLSSWNFGLERRRGSLS
jgi:predicted phosphodiesterase